MAATAKAGETLCALRREIARIEGTLPERLEQAKSASFAGAVFVRRNGLADDVLRSGAEAFDAALGGGLPTGALTEIHGVEVRDASASAGFALALVSLLSRDFQGPESPVLWVGTGEIFQEAGFPHAAGLGSLFGIGPQALLLSEARKLGDALWIAEEAARLTALSAVVLELRGNPAGLDLTATRRLHRRAQQAGRPVLLLRQGAGAEPTAAPIRLIVTAAPAAPRVTLAGLLSDSIGHPAFDVAIGKSRSARLGQFILEWKPHDRAFQERRPEISRSVVPASRLRPDLPEAPGKILAFGSSGKAPAPRDEPSRGERPAHRRTRRAG